MSNSNFKALLILFIGALIALAFMLPIANEVVGQSQTQNRVNDSVTTAAVNETIELIGRELVGTVTVQNSSGDLTEIANFTFANEICADGLICIKMKTTDAAVDTGDDSTLLNVTYEFKPDGYLNDSGARSVTTLIPLFAALAIVVFSIVMFWPNIRDFMKN